MAERQRATGADLINAVVLGYDVGVRMVEACGGKFSLKQRSHLYPDFLYAVGAAVAGCRLLGLAPIKHAHAMALVTFQTNGLASLYQEARHVSKSLCNGQFAAGGVSAALMADVGLEGVEDILGMRDGLLEAWGVEGGAQAVMRGLGQDWSVSGANFKFINAGYPIHAAVEAALTLRRTHGLESEAIASVVIGMPEKAMRVVDGREMHNICMQDMVSAALVQGGLSLRESPFPAILADARFAALRPQASVAINPDLNREQPEGRGARVTIQTRDGRTLSHRVDAPRGHSRRGEPSWDDLAEKWRDGLPHCDVDRMVALARRLEDLDDVRLLIDAFQTAPV